MEPSPYIFILQSSVPLPHGGYHIGINLDFLSLPSVRQKLLIAKMDYRLYLPGNLRVCKLLRRQDLSAWAQKHEAYILLEMPRRPEPYISYLPIRQRR